MAMELNVDTAGDDESLEEIRARYPREYIVMEVTARDALGQPARGRVLIHARTRKEAFARAKSITQKGLAFFNNVFPEDREQYAYLLYLL